MEAKIKRSIYASSHINIDFFMFEPELMKSSENSDTLVMNYIPMLTIIPIKPNGIKEYSKETFKIYMRNYWKVLSFFKTMVDWFYDTSMNDLFLEKDGKVVFNYDYKNLSALVETRGKEIQMMKGVPTTVEYGTSTYEAVIIYINNLENMVVLTFRELEDVYHTLKDFNFQTEVNTAVSMLLNERLKIFSGEKKELKVTSQFTNSSMGMRNSVPGSAINPFKL